MPKIPGHPCEHPSVHIWRCCPTFIGNEANLGVVSSEIQDENIEYQEFFVDSVSLIVPHDHPWAMRRVISPEELLNEPLIIREASSGTRRMLLSQLAKFDIGIDDLNIFMELGSAEAIVRTVATGYGISFVSSLASACPLERGNVVDVRVQGFNMHRKVYMIRKRLEVHHRAQEVFWGFVHSPVNIDVIKLAEGKHHHG